MPRLTPEQIADDWFDVPLGYPRGQLAVVQLGERTYVLAEIISGNGMCLGAVNVPKIKLRPVKGNWGDIWRAAAIVQERDPTTIAPVEPRVD